MPLQIFATFILSCIKASFCCLFSVSYESSHGLKFFQIVGLFPSWCRMQEKKCCPLTDWHPLTYKGETDQRPASPPGAEPLPWRFSGVGSCVLLGRGENFRQDKLYYPQEMDYLKAATISAGDACSKHRHRHTYTHTHTHIHSHHF